MNRFLHSNKIYEEKLKDTDAGENGSRELLWAEKNNKKKKHKCPEGRNLKYAIILMAQL